MRGTCWRSARSARALTTRARTAMNRRVQISAILVVVCYAWGAKADERAGHAPSFPGGHSVVATANHETSNYDCFSEASSNPATALRLVEPKSLEWNRRVGDEINLVVDVINGGKKTWLVNRRGLSGFSPLPGHQEFFLRITEPNGHRWMRSSEGQLELEGLYPKRKDYVEVRGGRSLKISIRFGSAKYPLPNGTYRVEICFWDRWRYPPRGVAELFGSVAKPRVTERRTRSKPVTRSMSSRQSDRYGLASIANRSQSVFAAPE